MNTVLRPVSLLRPMSPDDVASVARIEGEICAYPWTLGNFADSLHAGYSCWVNDFGDGIASYGVLMVAAGEAQLLNLGVATAWQGRGLGQEMLGHLTGVARSHRAEVLLLEVRESNHVARRLYDRHGFRQLAIRRRYYPSPQGREDAVVMELPL